MLKQWVGKTVAIRDAEDGRWRGDVIDYAGPDENETGEESLILQDEGGSLIEFSTKDIATIRHSAKKGAPHGQG